MTRSIAWPFFGVLLLLASAAWGQVKTLAPPADPQRPDGTPPPAEVEAEVESPGSLPADPQRPDEKRPATVAQSNLNLPREIHLTLTPAAEPVPALKYALLPGPLERTPGNGATNYYRALLHAQQVMSAVSKEERERYAQDYDAWLEQPLKKMPRDQVEKWVTYYKAALAETKSAAYREECHWNLRIQDLHGLDTISFLLHDFQGVRDLARVLRLRARLEVSDGKLDDALETVRQGLQLSRDTTEPELLINGLIGIAIASLMGEELIEIIDQPGSPNLYWALASLPRPLIDMRRGMRFEMDMPERMFPFLKDAETAQRTPEEWQRLMVEAVHNIEEAGGGNSPRRLPEWQSRLVATAGLMMIYPEAKKRLIEEGFDKEELEKMPVAQVVAIQTQRAQRRIYHSVFKWISLPYAQQGSRSDDTMKNMVAASGGPGKMTADDPLFLARLLLPAVQQAMSAEIRLQSNLAAIQAIEALRMHAAAHEGQLPRTLEETIVPVPLNPATDKPFPYELKDGVATLMVPTPAGQATNSGNSRKYIIRMEKN